MIRPIILCCVAVWLLATQETIPVSAPPEEGEILAKVRCGVCHVYPEPSLLPKAIWEEVILPEMGWQMGIYPNEQFRNTLFEKGTGGDLVRAAGVFPEKPQVTPEDWEKIKAFYLKNAPDSLQASTLFAVKPDLKQFSTRIPDLKLSPPSATLVRFRKEGGLFLGDANSKRLYWMDKNLKVEKAANLAEGVVDLQRDTSGSFVTIMGSFSPTDAPVGFVIYIPDNNPRAEVLLDNLQRPVCSVWADFNGDGLLDGVVCEFAKWTGGLTLHLRQPDGTFKRSVLRNRPGAIKCYTRDLNQDGYPDLIALFGQGDEGIYRYINDGKGNFTEERVLRFPSTYGSSSFRLVDVNADGREDIVYTCGDNADYKPVLKPYHGIRFYADQGNGQYAESLFFPLNGAYDAIPADFDADGDLDLAVISFFPDFPNRPEEAFMYMENDGTNNYTAHSFPEVRKGRWIVMDAGDLDGDGDIDLVLGPLTFEVVPDGGEVDRWVKEAVPFVVLENKGKP